MTGKALRITLAPRKELAIPSSCVLNFCFVFVSFSIFIFTSLDSGINMSKNVKRQIVN